MDRSLLIQEYRHLMGVNDRPLPGLDRFTDERLAETVGKLRRTLNKSQAAREAAKSAVTALRQLQAKVVTSEASVIAWLSEAVVQWEIDKMSSAFYPFQHAVDLYGSPLPGLEAAAERMDETSGARLRGGLVEFKNRLQSGDVDSDWDGAD